MQGVSGITDDQHEPARLVELPAHRVRAHDPAEVGHLDPDADVRAGVAGEDPLDEVR